MAKWKSVKKSRSSISYLQFDEGEIKEVRISDWDFEKSSAGYLFKCYVIEENGQTVDKVWTVWDYDTSLNLKKVLGVKFLSGSKVLKVKMRSNDDGEDAFEIL